MEAWKIAIDKYALCRQGVDPNTVWDDALASTLKDGGQGNGDDHKDENAKGEKEKSEKKSDESLFIK